MRRGTETILLCEDEAAVRAVATAVLERGGYEVIAVKDGAEALAAVEQRTDINLLLTDVVMPGMNGRQLAEGMSQKLGAHRVLFMSGYTQDEVLLRGLETGHVDILQKPFTPEWLLKRVRQALDTAARSPLQKAG